MNINIIPSATFVASLCFIASNASAANIVSDPGFESGLTVVGDPFTQADSADFDKWVYRAHTHEWTTVANGGNPDGYASAVYDTTNVRRTLYQAVTDDKATTGLVDLTFDLNLTSSTGSLVTFVWGIETISGATFSLTTSNQTAVSNGDATLLRNETYSTDTSGWETQTIADIDFGTGYDVVILGFKGVSTQTANGDFLGIDNVSIIPESSAYGVLAGMLALGFVVLRRRR